MLIEEVPKIIVGLCIRRHSSYGVGKDNALLNPEREAVVVR